MLSQNERNSLAQQLLNLSVFYGKYDLTKEQISIYISVLENHFKKDFNILTNALESYSKDSKNKFFPAPANLSQYINPETSADAQANEIASKIRQAISEIGYVSPTRAHLFIGDIGWQVVQRSGGWQYICENHGASLSPLTFYAQSRDTAKSIIENNKINNLTTNDFVLGYENKKTDIEINDLKREQILKLSDHLKTLQKT